MGVMSTKKSGYLNEVAISLMVLLFAYASLSKLLEHESFYDQLRHQPYISTFAPLLTWLIPSAEFTIAVGLLFKPFQLTASYLFILLMGLFTLYIIVMLAGGSKLPCSCGGIIRQLSWKQHLIFNGCFLLVGFWTIRQQRK